MTRNRQLTEGRIQDAAIRILSETGFEGWGINAIAREAGVDKVLIYRYFNSLGGLLDSIVEATDFWPDPDSLPSNSPTAFIEGTIARMRAEPQAWVLMTHPPMRGQSSPVRLRFDAARQRWVQGLRELAGGIVVLARLERLASLIYAEATSDTGQLRPSELWQEVSNNSGWGPRSISDHNEELPVELL